LLNVHFLNYLTELDLYVQY